MGHCSAKHGFSPLVFCSQTYKPFRGACAFFFWIYPPSSVKNQISSRAREVWTLMAFNGSPEKPEVWVRQPTVAEQLGCSTDTIGRALKELMRKGLIVETGRWHQGRYKVYRLNWNPKSQEEIEESRSAHVRTDLPPKRTPTFRSTPPSPSAKVQDHVPQKCGKLTRVLEDYEKSINTRATDETPEEREWIIKTIWTDQREAEREEQVPICPENYPIRWGYLRIKWADAHRQRAA